MQNNTIRFSMINSTLCKGLRSFQITFIVVALSVGSPVFAAKPYVEGEGSAETIVTADASGPTPVTGRVTNLKLQRLGDPVLYFTLDNLAGCYSINKPYFFNSSDIDYIYAFKALLAASLSGREIKLNGVEGCPSSPTLISASSVRIIESSPQQGPPAKASPGLSGTVTNLKIQQGVVYFRISSCDGSNPYFKFTSSRLPGGFSLLIAAQNSKRQVEVFTSVSLTSSCPSTATGDLNLGSEGGLALL